MSAVSLNPIPKVHPVPGGFVAVTPHEGQFVVESFVFVFVPDSFTVPMSSPLLIDTVVPDDVESAVANHKQEIARVVGTTAVTS